MLAHPADFAGRRAPYAGCARVTSLSAVLLSGLSGLRAAQSGISSASQNITNANTGAGGIMKSVVGVLGTRNSAEVQQALSVYPNPSNSGFFNLKLNSGIKAGTQVVVFDTSVVDLSDKLADPVDVLFGTKRVCVPPASRWMSVCSPGA